MQMSIKGESQRPITVLVHRVATHTGSVSLARARHIMDTVLVRRWRHILHSVLALHASRIRLPDIPGTWRQVESIGSDKLVSLWRLPLGRLARIDVQNVHRVDLLKRSTLRLAEEEVDHDCAEEVAGGEDVTVAVVNSAGDEGREEGDKEVPDPVRCGGETHGLRSVPGRVQLAYDGPDDWCPGHGIPCDEQAGEHDHGGAGAWSVLRSGPVKHEVADTGKDHEADEHPQTTGDQGPAAAKSLNNEGAGNRHAEVDYT